MFRCDRFAALRAFTVLLAAASLLALLAAACGGEGDKGETPQAGQTPAAGETALADGAEETEGEDGAADDEGAGGDGVGEEGLQELRALAEKEPEGATAKVTYRVTTNKDGETFETEQVQVRRPPDSRIEYSSTVDGEGTRSIVINAGGKMYNCFERGGEESCWVREIEATEAGAPFGTPRYLVERVEDIDLLDMSLRQIAGLDATCFAMTIATPNPHEEEHCFSNEGLLLYWQSEFELASVAWEATSVSNDVTDVDFEPPYEIVEVPDFEIPEP